MNLYRPNRRGGRKGRRRLLLATAFVIVVFMVDGFSGGYIRMLVRSAGATLWGTVTGVGESIAGSGVFSTRRALESENATLRQELTEVRLRAAAFDFLKTENGELRRIAQMAESSQGITAPIVSSFRSSPYGTFLIGAGTLSGISVGDLVLIGDSSAGFVIGRIDSVSARVAVVKELLAPDESMEGVVNGVSIIFDGHGGGQAQGEAPRDAEIKVGDFMTSPTSGGHAIGVVGKIEEDSGGASMKVFAHVPVSMYEVRFVYVLTQ